MFKSAIIQLTAWYVIIIMFITVSFSAYLYLNMLHDTKLALDFQKSRIEKRLMQNPFFPTPPEEFIKFHEDALEEIREKFLLSLLIINGAILVSASVLGYFLAKRTLQPIEEMVNKQKRFVSDAAHEIKTPVTAIKTNLEVTVRDKNMTISDAKESISQTLQQIDTLTYITDKLLKQSKYQNKEILELKKVDIQKNIQAAINQLKLFADTKKVTIETNLKTTYIFGNSDSLLEMNKNLIENAIKYSNENSVIKIICKKDGENAVIKYIDKGRGISKKDLEHIFEPFYRADKSREKNKIPGFGLGLTIVKEIVEKHKGKIDINSIFGKGTTITITFPSFSKSSV